MKYALLIGNNNYDDPKLPGLNTPTADLEQLSTVLHDKKIGYFDQVESLVDKNEFDVRRAIGEFLSNRKNEDVVLIYFSGHGVLDGRGNLFLALKDTDTKRISVTAISSDFIKYELENCRSQKKILILDCCYSGAFKRGTKAAAEKAIKQSTFKGNGSGYFVLTASDSTQRALEGDQIIDQTKLSLFTHFLLEGLTTGKADTDEDGNISLNDWYDYSYEQVTSITSDQAPCIWNYGSKGTFYVAANPFLKKSIAFPKDLNNLIENSRPVARMDAAEWLGELLRSSDSQMAHAARLSLEGLAKDKDFKVSLEAQKQLTEFEKSIERREIDEKAVLEKAQLEIEKQIRHKAAKEKEDQEAAERSRAEELARRKAEVLYEKTNIALQFEAVRDFENALKAYFEIRDLDPQYPNIEGKIGVLERKIQADQDKTRLEAQELDKQKGIKERIVREAAEKAAREKAELESSLKKMESSAIQYELKGDFWNARKIWYEIKRLDSQFPRVEVKIAELERELRHKSDQEVAHKQVPSAHVSPKKYGRFSPQVFLVFFGAIALMFFVAISAPIIASLANWNPASTIISTPTKGPTPTRTVALTATKTKIPTATPRPLTFSVYDNFSSGSSSNKFDTALWKDSGGEATISWQSGYLVFSGTNGGHELESRLPSKWKVDQIGKLQADLRIDSVKGGYAFSKIGIATTLTDGKGTWWVQCRVGSYDGENAQIICDSYRWGDGPEVKYQTSAYPIEFNKFYTVAIEISPDASSVHYYVDGKEIGEFLPEEKNLLVKAAFTWSIGLWMNSDVTATGAVDNVKIGK